jgi:lysophospholipase L1-like esterase
VLIENLSATGGFETVNMRPTQLASSGWTVQSLSQSVQAWLNAATATPSFVLINIGVNDTATSQASFEASLADVLDKVHTKWPSAAILVWKIWRRGSETQMNLIDDTYIPNVLASRPWATSPAELDERVYLKGSDNGALETTDGLHPTTLGFALWAAAAQAAMGY